VHRSQSAGLQIFLNDIQNIAPIVAAILNIARGYLRCSALYRSFGSDTSHISGYPKFPFRNPSGFLRKTSDHPRALGEKTKNFLSILKRIFGNFAGR
jgi:hypothetical protein